MPMPLLRLANSIAKQKTEIHIETSDGSNRLPYKRLSFPFLSIATMVTFLLRSYEEDYYAIRLK